MAKKKKTIDYDLESLKKIFENDNSNNSTIALALIKKAKFIDDKLTDLEGDINFVGLNVEMQQGSYSITRANPSIASYNAFIKNYNAIIKQLIELLPKENLIDENEENYF